MSWIKQGRIFQRDAEGEISSHCQVPTPYIMDDRIRVFYSCRRLGRSFITYFDLSRDLSIVALPKDPKPILEAGKPGMFDSDGVMPSCIVKEGSELWMYYIGWSKLSGDHARYQNEIGLAVSKDGGETFKRMFDGPVMGRTPMEPGLAVMPFVIYKNWFRMWYQSGTGWTKIGEQYEPLYVIKHANSIDGVTWERKPEQCIRYTMPLEAFSRPTVWFDEMIQCYHMMYCYRDSADYRGGAGSYRIGKAVSPDGLKWQRDNFIFPLGEKGEWDSDMTCYPYVIEVKDKLVLFYNGNAFGQSGIGIAVWEELH